MAHGTFVFAVALSSLLGIAVYAVQNPQGEDKGAEPCHTTFSSGAGPTFMKVCISATGNVQSFESPEGYEHIAVGDSVIEGYALCDSGYALDDFFDDAASYDGGAEAASLSDFNDQAARIYQPKGPNTFPLTITRDPTAHGLVLRQDYSRDTTRKELIINMRVTNTAAVTVQGVRLTRFFDGDADNQWWDNVGGASADAAWIRRRHGLMLSALTFDKPHAALWTCSPGSFLWGGRKTSAAVRLRRPPRSVETWLASSVTSWVPSGLATART